MAGFSRRFTTIGGMVKLTPDQQAAFIRDQPASFKPENGVWGRQGCTGVLLAKVDEETLGEALTLAWRNTSQKIQRPRRPLPRR